MNPSSEPAQPDKDQQAPQTSDSASVATVADTAPTSARAGLAARFKGKRPICPKCGEPKGYHFHVKNCGGPK